MRSRTRARLAPRALGLLGLLGLLTAAACSAPSRPIVAPAPAAAPPDARALAVYRAVADSIYVRTTDRPIAVVATSLDTSCTSSPCAKALERWGLSSLWWAGTDSAEARSARNSLLARSEMRFDLRDVPRGARSLVAIDESVVPIPGSDAQSWIAFRDGNYAAVGALQFSGVGFGESGQTAIVFVDWRCGPECGHTLSVSLRATSDTTWRIGDMLLLSSLQK